MNTPAQLKYTKTDEWFDPASGGMGLTDYAQSQLSDIVFIEILVDVGDQVEAGKPIASVESVKAVSDVFAPVSGIVLEVNDDLPDNPAMVNEDPYGDGWMIKVEMNDPAELEDLMTAAEYQEYISEDEEPE